MSPHQFHVCNYERHKRIVITKRRLVPKGENVERNRTHRRRFGITCSTTEQRIDVVGFGVCSLSCPAGNCRYTSAANSASAYGCFHYEPTGTPDTTVNILK